MKAFIDVKPAMIKWAIERADLNMEELISKNPNVKKWINEEKKPTIKQLENFSKKVHLPFGYFFLSKPPDEKLPIPFFRTFDSHHGKVSRNVFDTVLIMQQRQDWLRDYLKDNDFEPLQFVGKYKNSEDVEAIVSDMRNYLRLSENWASQCSNWAESLDVLTTRIEEIGIIPQFNGVVENNTHRPISVEECRGFVLVDEYAPFIFINNSDAKAAQMFTIAHELAHVWTGQSAGFDFRKLEPANEPIEILCNKVAAEFLVPEKTFDITWNLHPSIQYCSRFFKVSEIVIARRALDTGNLTKEKFYEFYEQFINREHANKLKQGDGGDFFATAKKRLSISFANHVNEAVKSRKLLQRDAYNLTSLKGETYHKFFSQFA